MKRVLTLFAALAIVLASAVPASADDYDPWIDIAEVCTVNNSGSNYFAFNDKTTVTLSPGFSTIVGRIDMIWFCGYGPPKSVYLWRNNAESYRLPLRIEQISGAYYRISSSVGNYTLSDYRFDIECGEGAGYRSYEIKSCRIIEGSALSDCVYNYTFSDGYLDESEWFDDGVHMPSNGVSEAYGRTCSYKFDIWAADWNKFDYLDLYISTERASISSISVVQGGKAVPFTVSSLLSDNVTETNGSSADSPLLPSVCTVIHIDLTSASRTLGNDPHIVITGSWNNSQGANLRVQSFVGYVQSSERTGPAYWFEKGKQFFLSLFCKDDPEAEAYQSEMESQAGALEDAVDEMDQVTKPAVDDLDLSFDEYMSGDASEPLNGFFDAVFGNQLIVTMLVISLTCAFVSYALYGKR